MIELSPWRIHCMQLTEHEVEELLRDIFGLTASLTKESERASVIIAGARLDVDLERLIKHVLQKHPGGTDPLFDSDRALGTFSAKIALSYRLGIVDGDFEHALQLVRKIRNDFAHQLEEESLSSQRQKPRLAELIRWIERSTLYESAIKVINPEGKTPEHVRFTACVVCMATELKRGLRSLHRVYLGPPLSCTATYVNSRILLTQDKFVEESLKGYLIADPALHSMKFLVDVSHGKVGITRLPSSLAGEAKTFGYNYAAPEDGSLSKELERLYSLIRLDLLHMGEES